MVAALLLPEDGISQIRETVFSQVKLEDLKNEDGMATLITFLRMLLTSNS